MYHSEAADDRAGLFSRVLRRQRRKHKQPAPHISTEQRGCGCPGCRPEQHLRWFKGFESVLRGSNVTGSAWNALAPAAT